MAGYPQIARDITAQRKLGDVDGAIAIYKNADLQVQELPEVKAATAWCLYDRDIKSCVNADFEVTETMLDKAAAAVRHVRRLCERDLYSKYSPYPWCVLGAGRLFREHGSVERLVEVMSQDDPRLFSAEKDSQYPSQRDQWVSLALDSGKLVLGNANLTKAKAQTLAPILANLKSLNDLGGLSTDKPSIEVNGQKKRIPSIKQRFALQYSRFLQETDRNAELVEFCDALLADETFLRDPNLKWILYRLARGLVDTDPRRALAVCTDFVAMEYRPYSLLLLAEIHLALDDKQSALREAAHSLQIIGNRDLPYITGNLTFIADLTDDPQVERDHIQMVRAIRLDGGLKPSPAMEQRAVDLGLPPATQAPSADQLRAQWNVINPEQKRPNAVNAKSAKRHAAPKRAAAGERERIDLASFDRQSSRAGEIVFAPLTAQDGTQKRRPVLVVGERDKELLVALLHTNPTSPRAVPLTSWQEANLKNPTSFVPSYRVVETASVSALGRISDADLNDVRNA